MNGTLHEVTTADLDGTVLDEVLHAGDKTDATNHGDPLPANLLLTERDGCALLDFEFTGLYLRGLDLAMLHTLLAATPGAQDAIEAPGGEAGSRYRS